MTGPRPRRRAAALAAAVLVIAHAGVASAQDGALALSTVLEATVRTHPALDEARAAITEQDGRALAATAAFEPTIGAAGQILPVGFYEYWQLAVAVEQTVPDTGIRVRGGYRLGQGDIPDYYGERETLDGGELFASVVVPVLADRSIDKARAELWKARLAIGQARARLALTWLEVARDATVAYWTWVAAGQQVRVAEELLRIATARADQIAAEADTGARPRIEVVDADRVVLARRSSLLEARGAFAEAQQALALYYRADDGTPVVVPLDRVPAAMGAPPPVRDAEVDRWIADAQRARPDLEALDVEARQADVDRDLARNHGLPTVDVSAFVARDLGSGSPSLAPTEVGVGITVTIPVQRRRARGELRQAAARRAQVEAKQRGLRDRIAAELREAAQLAQLAAERVALARERLAAAERLAEAERIRLDQGASDVLVVNLRELDVAAAAGDAIAAGLELHRAAAALLFARGQTALGAPP